MSVLSPTQRIGAVLALAFASMVLFGSTAAAAPSFEVSLVNAEGSDVQAVYVEATTGEFRLDFGTGGPGISETVDIPATATPAEVEAALNALANVSAGGGSVSVVQPSSDTNGTNPYLVTFGGGPLALKLQPLMKAASGTVPLGASPLGGGPATAYVTTWVPGGIRRGDERTDYTVKVKNVSLPSTGAVETGDTLTCQTGNWLPVSPASVVPALSFEWRRGGATIPGASGSTYVVTPEDAGQTIQCVVIGTNPNATTKFASLNPVVANPQPATEPPKSADPKNAASRPTIAGTGTASRTCAAPANWTAGATFGFQWLRNGQPIAGQTTSSYVPSFSAVGTGTWATGSNQVTVVSTSSGAFAVGERINGNGIPPGTTITEVSGETLTISANTTAAGTNAALLAGVDAGVILQCEVIGENAGGKTAGISNNSAVGTVSQPPNNTAAQTPSIADPNLTSGTVTASVELPGGLESFAYLPGTGGTGWNCAAQPAIGVQPAKVVCTSSTVIGPGSSYPDLTIAIGLGADAPDVSVVKATVSGGGANAAVDASSEFNFSPFPGFGFIPNRFIARALDVAGEDFTQAGGHPMLATTSASFNRLRSLADDGGKPYERHKPVAPVHDLVGDIPPGFIGNPQAIPDLCPSTSDLLQEKCSPASVVGEAALRVRGLGEISSGSTFVRYPLYAIEPEAGVPAEFALVNTITGGVYVLQPHLRPGDGYAISIESSGVLENPPILDLRVTLCSFGANLGGPGMNFQSCKTKDDPDAFSKPFLTAQTECASSGPVTKLHADSWADRGEFETAEAVAPKMTGCDLVPFEPGMSLEPTSKEAESASGLDVDISFSSEGLEDPDGLSQAHLKRATVALPPGMSVNPASADGLAACTQAQLGMVNGVPNDEPVQCPDASKIGTVELKTPILAETLKGNVYLAKQGDNPFGTLLGLYVVAESKERGVLIKIPGRVDIRDNGQLVSTFDDNPQAPFSSLKLHFNSGARAPLMTPQRCGTYQIASELTPWSAEDPDNPTAAETVTKTSAFEIESGPEGGPCPNGALQPTLEAGLSSTLAGASSPFIVNLSRKDGTQRFNGLSMTLPPGLSANLTGVPYCSDAALSSVPTAEGTGAAEIANPSCPEASRLGSVLVGAGAGKPFYVNGKVYLAGPYKGAPVSLAVVVPAVAGPFDLGNVVVRNAAFVNPKTAQITVASDPLPTVLHKLPIDVRSIRVTVDRPGFMQAPTNCEPMSIDALVSGEEGGSAPVSNRFQVGECGNLGFSPNLKLKLKGGTKRNKYQQLTATLTARPGDANIAFTSVRFPQSIFLAQEHIGTVCTRVQFAADACPPRSVYGQAEAVTPLLDRPLVGPVYLRSSDNVLPDLVAALRGPDNQPIEVELVGRTDSKNRGNRNTFDVVPDAPVSKFTLRMMGGKKSLLITSRNICLRKERASVRMRGQNGMVKNFRPVLQIACKKKDKKAERENKRR